MSEAKSHNRVCELLDALDVYRPARREFLKVVTTRASNRDPLAEFSEHLVHALMGGDLAKSPVQAGHDLVLPNGTKVQVRYLANTSKAWVNEHRVYRIAGVEVYALVMFEDFTVVGVLAFPTGALEPICSALRKQHPNQREQLLLTRANWESIRDDPVRFRSLGMQVWLPPLTQPSDTEQES